MKRRMARRVSLPSFIGLVWAAILLAAAMPTHASGRPRQGPGRAPSVDWPMFGFSLDRGGYNPDETALGPSTVGGLAKKWTFALGAPTVAQPVLAAGVEIDGRLHDVLYVGAENGYLFAVDAAGGKELWRAFVGVVNDTDGCGGPYGVDGTAVIDRATNRVYVPGGDDKVYALDLITGAVEPGWPVRISANVLHEHLWSALTLWQGSLYVPVAGYCDVPPYYGRLVQVDTVTAERVRTFWVTGKRSGVWGGGIRAMGGVSVDTATSQIYTSPGQSLTDVGNWRYAEHVVRLTDGLKVKQADYPPLKGGDTDFHATPMLFQPPGCGRLLAVENDNGYLFVYNRNRVSDGPLQSIEMAELGQGWFQNLPAYDPVLNRLFVSNSSDSNDGTYQHGLVAFRVGTGCRLELAWQQPLGPRDVLPPPTVANGVVYFGLASNQAVVAVDAASGNPLWKSGSDIHGAVYGAPMVVNGGLYVGATDGNLYAFGL